MLNQLLWSFLPTPVSSSATFQDIVSPAEICSEVTVESSSRDTSAEKQVPSRPARRRRQSLDALIQLEKALDACRSQRFDEPVHGDVLRIHVLLGDCAEVLAIFVVQP